MFSRKYYESEFNSYPDLVVLKEMRKMLGGITERKALDLLHSKQIKAFYIEQRYLIPKICIIDYLIHGSESPVDDKPPKKPVRSRKPGTGCLRQLNEKLWEGKFAPINSRGQRIARYNIRVFKTEIPRSVRAAEAAENGKSIFKHDRRGKVAEAYTALSKEVNEIGREAYRSRSDGAR